MRVLDGTKVTYSSWVSMFKLHVRGYKVLTHIIGIAPPANTDLAYETSSEINAIVLQWIYGTLFDDLLIRVLDQTTALDAWTKVKDIFLNNKGSRAAAHSTTSPFVSCHLLMPIVNASKISHPSLKMWSAPSPPIASCYNSFVFFPPSSIPPLL